MIIEMHAVVSSNVKEIGFDEPALALRVGFNNGSLYE